MKTERLRIGEWIADPATNELSRGTESVRIEPKAMDLLMVLARRRGDVVSREELFAQVWPGTVVGDEALTQAITKLRRALGDHARSAAYIETVPKRGYRLKNGVGGEFPKMGSDTIFRWTPAKVAFLLVAACIPLAWLISAPPPPAAPEQSPRTAPGPVTVTVLPFEPLGGGREQAYLAHGISDSLVTDLGRVAGLRMIHAPGAARYVVSGTVQREADTLRINVRLVDTSTSAQLWSERFERPAGELFAVQDELIQRLVKSLPATLSDAERQRLARPHTRSLEAYDHFLRAQALFLARDREANASARALYAKALEIDPRFARAYAGLAMTHAIDDRMGWPAAGKPGLERALELAETARQIDPDIAEVHWALGFVHAQARRHDRALESLQRAIDLNPSFADAHALMGGIQTYRGEPAKSIPLVRTAMRLNPEGGYLYFLILGRAYLFENDIEQALINLREARVRNPADLETHVYLAAALTAAEDKAGAEWETHEIKSLERDFSLPKWLEGYPLSSARHAERLRELLAKAGL
jgi:DNA-binding winged helix-turn-helix (wHTH) protein/TolB-like protein/Flp pilus assembly protein TadD